MTLDDLLPYVLPSAKSCPEPVAVFNIRLAVIEFCRETLCWQETQPSQPTVAGLITYDYNLADGQAFVKLLSLTLAGSGLAIVDPEKGRVSRSTCDSFAFGQSSGFTLNPAPADDLAIKTTCAVCPTRDAILFTDDMDRYAEQLARGALSKILNIAKRDFSDPREAEAKRLRFEEDKACAKSAVLKGFARSFPRTRAVWF